MLKGTKHRALSWVAGFVCAAAVVFAAAVYLFSVMDGRPRVIQGYSAYIVLTGSMQREIPQGSLVVAKETEPPDIRVGDDITFLKPDGTLCTHRVANIFSDYEQSGMTGFQTWGLENREPDREVVFADNVVGKVVYHDLQLGLVLAYVRDRALMIILLAALATAAVTALQFTLRAVKKANSDPMAQP